VPGVKRPRGRPRIHPVPDPALKRPRGRPRKNAPISYAEVDTDSDVDSPRVKKEKELQTSPLASASASTSASAQVTPQTGPKRRGRPPKVRPAPYEIPYDTPEPAKATAAIPVAGVEAEAKPAPEAKDATLNAAASSSRLRAAGDVIAAAGAAAQSVNKTVNSLKLKFTVPPPSAGPEPASPATPSVHRATPKQVEKAKRNGAPAGYAFVSAPATPTPATATAHSTPAASGSGSSLNVETTDLGTPESARQTPKQAEKAKRNGAPAGWAYVVDGAQKATSAGPTPPSDRAARLAARRN
jgi:hypothetical protein